MISLRQHIFSLVAVFVALAIGIAAGSTVVRGPLLDSTRARLESAERLIDTERAENKVLAAEVAQLNNFAADAPSALLTGLLRDSAVLLVVAGDVDRGVVDGVVRSLGAATTMFMGEIRLDPAVFDPDQAGRVAAAAGIDPASGAGVGTEFGTRVAALIDAIGGQVTASSPTPTSASLLKDTFASFEDAGLVDVLHVPATAVHSDRFDVVVLTDRNLGHDPAAVLDGVLAPLAAPEVVPVMLVAEVGRVLQDNASPVPSYVATIRDDGRRRDEYSTVDNAETFLGWIALVLGLGAGERGEIGQYGFRDGAERAIPRPAP
jgi:hypothetical protein